MNRATRRLSSAVLALMTAIVITLPGCGGGSSTASGGGGGSGGTIAGNVDSSVAVIEPSGRSQGVFLTLADVMVREARAGGVPDVTVELLDGNGAVVATTTTDASGNFMFSDLAPGSYRIRLSQGPTILGETPSVQVDSNTKTNLKLSLNGGVTSVEVEGEGSQISGEVQTSQGSNEDSNQGSNAGENESGDDNSSSATDDGNDDNGAGDDDSDDHDAADDNGNDGGSQNGGGSEQED